MYEKVVVPLDGSRFSEFALPIALGLLERTGGHLTLVTAVSNLSALPRADVEAHGETTVHGWFEEERARAHRHLEDVQARIRAAVPGIRVDTKVLGNRPLPGLSEYVERTEPDLLVLSTHGRGALSRAWLGSVADGLLRRVSTPMLVVRPKEEGAPDVEVRPVPGHILVPLDGSGEGETILPTAEALAKLFGARVTLLTIVRSPAPMGYGYLPDVVEERHEQLGMADRAEQNLAMAAERLSGAGLDVAREVLVRPDVANAILDYAAHSTVDLIVMATHARRGASRMVLGSVADKVIRGGEIPVLAQRLPEEGA